MEGKDEYELERIERMIRILTKWVEEKEYSKAQKDEDIKRLEELKKQREQLSTKINGTH